MNNSKRENFSITIFLLLHNTFANKFLSFAIQSITLYCRFNRNTQIFTTRHVLLVIHNIWRLCKNNLAQLPLPLCAPVGRGYNKSAYAGKGIY
jgi:hypothetical protein